MQIIGVDPQIPFLLPMAVVALGLLVAFSTLLALLAGGRKNQIAHIERMRAMELGYILTERASRWPLAFYCVAMGAGVPIATFLITWIATLHGTTPLFIWNIPAIVSGIAIGGSTIVAAIAFS